MAFRDVADGRLQVEPPFESREQYRGGQESRARGGQLDRERQAVQANAQLGDRSRVVRGERERWAHGSGALHEQGDRGLWVSSSTSAGLGAFCTRRQRWLRQGWHRELPFGAQPQRLA